MNQCVFCRIAAGELPSHQIYQDESVVAFLDIKPVRPGHVLLIPRQHIPMMTEAEPQLLGQIYTVARDLMRRIKQQLAADYVMLYVVGIDVPHFHIHLLPRNFGDGLKPWPGATYAVGEAEAIVQKLKTATE